ETELRPLQGGPWNACGFGPSAGRSSGISPLREGLRRRSASALAPGLWELRLRAGKSPWVTERFVIHPGEVTHLAVGVLPR
ncbi:MAG TPA: hypothetical protein VJP77_06570, partial [Planctomycetota bacterium]|nr:hypothetical protein [Planctomycetota bacterium]